MPRARPAGPGSGIGRRRRFRWRCCGTRLDHAAGAGLSGLDRSGANRLGASGRLGEPDRGRARAGRNPAFPSGPNCSALVGSSGEIGAGGCGGHDIFFVVGVEDFGGLEVDVDGVGCGLGGLGGGSVRGCEDDTNEQ